MDDDFVEISNEDIESVERALKVNADYKLKNVQFNTNTFKKGMASIQWAFITAARAISSAFQNPPCCTARTAAR